MTFRRTRQQTHSKQYFSGGVRRVSGAVESTNRLLNFRQYRWIWPMNQCIADQASSTGRTGGWAHLRSRECLPIKPPPSALWTFFHGRPELCFDWWWTGQAWGAEVGLGRWWWWWQAGAMSEDGAIRAKSGTVLSPLSVMSHTCTLL